MGRKMDFLIQEVNRESNTIGSKCNDITIARDVVALKAEVEKRSASRCRTSSEEGTMKLINIGFGNLVSAERVLAIVSPDSAPIKRLIQESRELRYADRRDLRPKNRVRFRDGQRPCGAQRHRGGEARAAARP